ncbi:MAG TPA: hypothetical protein DCX60_05590 [Phycisphaerales bacterium]|nr:hypothetical protein [Phycisphaerales bacterium]
MTIRPQIMLSAVTVVCGMSMHQAQSQAETVEEVRELIGLNSLTERLGAGQVPTGAGIGILQCEASEGGANWGPDTSLVDFAGKSFTYPAGSPGVSSHATTVARWAYGSNWSVAPDISDIYVYEVGSFLLTGFLRTGQGSLAPKSLPDSSIRIMNHSWIGQFGNSNDNQAMNRFDYALLRDNVTAMVGRANDAGSDARLMAYAFNSLTVGTTSGTHATADTPAGFDGPGRMKPDIIAPGAFTSYSTAVASAAAAVIHETIQTDPVLAADSLAIRLPIMKAVLLAGASREGDWTNNPVGGVTARPIDEVEGAGIINIDRSHRIITGYRQTGALELDDAPEIALSGFDYAKTSPGQTRWWRFSTSVPLEEVGIALTWPRVPNISNYQSYVLMDIDLELVKIVDGAPEAIVDGVASGVYDSGNHKSNSRVDNVEMISIRGLAPGEYAIRMDRINSTTTTSGGIAWLFIESDEGPIGDFNGDFLVDGQDLAMLLSAWGTDDPDLDITGDGIIDGADLAQLLSNWS